MGTRICTICNQTKPLEEFIIDKRNFDGHGAWCLQCKKKKSKWYRINRPEENKKAQKKYYNKTKKRKYEQYGLTDQQFDDLLELSNGSCMICGLKPENWWDLCIDHDHGTNKVRGLLCNPCNRGLGMFKDSADMVSKALHYLNYYNYSSLKEAKV